MEINKKEKEFALKAIEFYWDNWNRFHEDNLDDASISDSLVKKLDLCSVMGQREQLINFLIHLNDKGLINNHDFDYEKEAKKYIKKIINCP